MGGITRSVEITANIAIIIVSTMIVGLIAKKYSASLNAGAPHTILVGAKVSLPSMDWSNNKKSLVIALQTSCRYCSESGSFYQRLVLETGIHKVPIVAVFPQTTAEGQAFFSNLNVPITNIRQASLRSIGVQVTPAILLVDNKGEIKASWLGKLSPDKESEVLNSLIP